MPDVCAMREGAQRDAAGAGRVGGGQSGRTCGDGTSCARAAPAPAPAPALRRRLTLAERGRDLGLLFGRLRLRSRSAGCAARRERGNVVSNERREYFAHGRRLTHVGALYTSAARSN